MVDDAPYPSKESVMAALSSLNIDSDPFVDDSSFQDVAYTLAEEITDDIPRYPFTYNPASPSADMPARFEALLSARGYDGPPDDRHAILDFLAAEVTSARLIAHLEPLPIASADAATIVADTSVATSLSRLCTVLSFSADAAAEAKSLPDLLSLIIAGVSGACLDLGAPLIDPETAANLSPDTLAECERISDALEAEHQLRKKLLMHRLSVTIQCFGYSDKASADAFHSVQRSVARAVEAAEQPIGVYDALVARDWLLDVQRVSSGGVGGINAVRNEVKRILMGSVPDRGGRVGAAAVAKANMPQFKPRVSGSSGRGGDGRGGRGGRGRGQGRGKRN
jgi:hypothetical protein